ncbi:MAG: VWA domain-containing protein [Bacteroidales bacterium]|nr:VWA domain-containing protein [Bacteroidales bacterium]MCF8332979.1 VWA domain-containing protein [Bacteroidales bacterium]
MVRLENIEYLHLFWIVGGMIILFWFTMRWKKRALQRYGDLSVYQNLVNRLSFTRPKVKFFVLILATAFLILGIVNPQIGSRLKEAERKGVDLIVALDVSSSMNARDIKPSRLDRAKQAISSLIDRLSGDRIGIIVFAGQAYTQLPITTDYSAGKMFLSNVDSDIVPTQGTAIGNAIDLAMDSFTDNDHSKAIIVITDGENHDQNAMEMAQKARGKGINVHTIGMGLPDGGPIPIYNNGEMKGFKKDRQGNTVVSKLNEQLLRELAEKGGGMYVRANNTKAGLNAIFEEINKMEKKEFETKTYADYEDRFQYFIAISLILFILEAIMVNRRSQWADSFKLFEKNQGGQA